MKVHDATLRPLLNIMDSASHNPVASSTVRNLRSPIVFVVNGCSLSVAVGIYDRCRIASTRLEKDIFVKTHLHTARIVVIM